MNQRTSLWAPVVLYMAFIFGLSSIHNPPKPPGGVTDKDLHIALYTGLGTLIVRALAGGWRRRVTLRMAALAVLITVLYGVSDEMHQYFVVGRTADVYDVLADLIGGSIAAAGLYAYTIISSRHDV